MKNAIQKTLAVTLAITSLSTPVWAQKTENIDTTPTPIVATQSPTVTGRAIVDPMKTNITALQVAQQLSNGLYYTRGYNLGFSDYTTLYNAMTELIKSNRYNIGTDNLYREKMTADELLNSFKSYDEIMSLYQKNNLKLPKDCLPCPIWNGETSVLFTPTTTAGELDWSFIPANIKEYYLNKMKRSAYDGSGYIENATDPYSKVQNAFTEANYNPDNIEVMEVYVDSYKDLPSNVYALDDNCLKKFVGGLKLVERAEDTLPNGRVIPRASFADTNLGGVAITCSSNGYISYDYGICDKSGAKTDKLASVFTLDNIDTIVCWTITESFREETTVNGVPMVQTLAMPKILIIHIGK